MTVGVGRAAVEAALRGGELGCPVCAGRLAPWGWARGRVVRGEVGAVGLRPRRARCGQCRRTHVLLPASVLLRRADEVTVIGAALLARAGGCGHRRIATRLGLPASTVRGWLRRIGAVADPVLAALGVLAAELGGEFVAPAPTGGPVAAVVELVGALAGAVVRRLGGSCAPWRLAAVVCGGRLLSPHGPDLLQGLPGASNTSWLWAAER
ncbi:MAG: helix-turn-helix domain-containing protein [Actinobacteria bacterium]|nr:helix-turn-helix domain-containing protein [Actinomycetota bacterium]